MHNNLNLQLFKLMKFMDINQLLWDINQPLYKLTKGQLDEEIYKRITRYIVDEYKNSKIIELGCGDGSLAKKLVGISEKITLVDFSNIAINECKKKLKGKKTKFICQNIDEYLKRSKEKADVIIFCRSFYSPNYKEWIKKAYYHLNKDGLFIIVNPEYSLKKYIRPNGKLSIPLLIKASVPRILAKIGMVKYELIPIKKIIYELKRYYRNVEANEFANGTHVIIVAKKK